jgi:hypothetical protein
MDPEKQQQCKRIIVAVSWLDAEGEVMLNISSQSLAKLLNSSPIPFSSRLALAR